MTAGAGFRILGSRVVAENSLLKVDEVDLLTPEGTVSNRLVIRLGDAVSVVPVVEDEVVLIRQYRTPVDKPLLELPAGKLDVPGEDPSAAAARELAEEAGFVAGQIRQLAHFYTSPGFLDEAMTVFIATDLTPVAAKPVGPEERAAEVVRFPIADLPELLPTIEDAKTLIGLMAFLLERS
jgi:ADP-ribose pyrophosphatase